jgi:DNA-directed RNA polymerase subunit RPC12/RpoP
MPKSFGVKCKKCGKHISLAGIEAEGDKEIAFYALPLGPIPCPHCGHKDEYASTDREYA